MAEIAFACKCDTCQGFDAFALALTTETARDWYALRERRDARAAYEDTMAKIAAGETLDVEAKKP
jgi:hypothetical protein